MKVVPQTVLLLALNNMLFRRRFAAGTTTTTPSLLSLLFFLFLSATIFHLGDGFDAAPSVCIVQYDLTTNSFSETLVYNSATPPVLHAYVCTKTSGTCVNKGVTLLPSGAHNCFRSNNKPELVVGSTTISDFFTPSNTLWTSKCNKPFMYTYGICQADATNDRTGVTALDLFPSSDSTSVLRQPSPPSTICAEQRCSQPGTSSYAWWRTISSFTVPSSGSHSFTLRGMAGDSTLHTHSPDGTSFTVVVGDSTCPAGSQLVGASCVKCSVGKYKIAQGTEACTFCQPGKYGTIEEANTEAQGCAACPAGRYGSGTASTSVDACVLCAAGKYCEAKSSDNLQLCRAGYHGSLGESSPQCSGKCPGGVYCSNGTAIGEAMPCGSHSTCTGSTSICWCPSGSIQPQQATPGQYTYGSPSGTTNQMTSVTNCNPGTYCQNGVQFVCPAGTYCDSYAMLRPGLLCSAGFFCPPGSSSRQQQACSDGTTCDNYCPEGTKQVLQVPSKFFTLPLASPCSERSSVQACGSNSLCRAGVSIPRLEYLGGLVSCGLGSSQLSLSLNENTPETPVVDLQVTEHSAINDVQVPPTKMSITTSVCADNNNEAFPFEIVAGSTLGAAPILRTKNSINGGAIQYAECRSYQMTLRISDSTEVFHSTCSITVTVTDINNSPVWSLPTLVGRFIPERSPKGTTVTTAANGILAESIVALDADVGQELTYNIIETYPKSNQGDLTLTRCGGVITVQTATLLYPLAIVLCVRACDDPAFFGGSTPACAPSSHSCTNVTVTLVNVNDPPTFQSLAPCSAGSPCTIAESSGPGTVVAGGNLMGSAMDQDGDALQWHLVSTGSEEFSIGLNDGIIVAGGIETDYELTRAYTLTVMVTDGSMEQQHCVSSWCESLLACCATRQVRIAVQNINDPPVWPTGFAATTQFAIDENSVVGTPIGSVFVASDQDHGSSVIYSVNDRERGVPVNGITLPQRVRVNNVLSGSSSVGQLVVDSVIDYETDSTIFIDLIATDNQNAKAVAENIRITVVDVNEPTTISNVTIEVGENTATGESVLTMSTIAWTDPDQAAFGVALTFLLLPSAFQSNFYVSTGVADLLLVKNTLNFETLATNPILLPFWGAQENNPTLKTNIAYIHVTVRDQNEAPVGTDETVELQEWVSSGHTSDTPVDGMTVLTFQGVDPENNIIEWRLLSSSNNFAVSLTGVLSITTANTLDYENSPVINLQVQVRDSGGLMDEVACQILLLDVNDPPKITTISQADKVSTWFSVSEHNSEAGAESEFKSTGGVVGTLTATDQDDSATPNGVYTFSLENEYTPFNNGVASSSPTFSISPESGIISVAAITPSLKTEGSTYKLSVKVRDNGTPSAFSVKNIYVGVIARNFRPTMSDVAVSVQETDPSVATIATMTATDPDGDDTTIAYSITSVLPDLRAGDGQRAFVLDTTTTVGAGIVRVNDGYTLDFENTKWQAFDQGVVHIKVQAVDENGAATVANCVVTIQDVNEAPSLGSKTYSIGEDWTVGTAIGAALEATDPDAVDIPSALKYTTTNSHFSIRLTGTTGGVIRTIQPLNFESVSVFDMQVAVVDTALNRISAAIRIQILDINEAPSVTSASANVFESSTPGSVITVVSANDPDAASMTALSFVVATVTPSLKTKFSISPASLSSAYVRHTSSFDYEDVQTYSIVVTVNDHGADFPFVDPSSGGTSTSLTASGIITVHIQDVNDIQIDSIQVEGVVDQAQDSSGGEVVDLVGINLGPTVSSLTTVSAYYGPFSDLHRYAAMNCAFRAPYGTVVRCTTVPGVGDNLLWSVVVGRFNYTSISLRTKYSAPQITTINGANQMSTQGGTVIDIIGSSFGPTSTTDLTVRYGTLAELQAEHWHLASNCTVAVAHTRIQCSSIPSSGAPLSWMVVVGQQKSAVFAQSTSGYASANVTRVYAIAAPDDTSVPNTKALNTLGGQTIEIVGENFGNKLSTSLTVMYGNIVALNCALVEDHVKIRCTTAPGCGRGLSWSVRVGPTDGYPESALSSKPRSNDPTIQISYAVPMLTHVSGDNVLAASSSGNDFVLLKGSGFGTSAGCRSNCRSTNICGNVVGARVFYSPKENAKKVNYEARCCEILSDSSMQCLMAPGAGRDLQWKVTVCGQSSAPLDTATAYGAPVIGSYGAAGSRRMHTEGGESITLNGLNFGPANAGNIEQVTFGAGNGTEYTVNPSSCRVSVAHQQITCTTTKGGGKHHKWVVTIAGQRSTVPTTSYQRPIIVSISGQGASDANMIGGETVTITGDNFGPLPSFNQKPFLNSVFYGPATDPYLYQAKACVVTISSTAISCTTVPGNGKLLRWTVTVAGQSSPLSMATTSYGDPILLSVLPQEGPTSGFQTTLVGINMVPSVLSSPLVSILFGSRELSLGIVIKYTGTYSQPSGREIQHVTVTTPVGVGLNIPVQFRIYTALDKTSYQASNLLKVSYSLPQMTSIHVTNSESEYFPFKITLEGTNFCENTACSLLTVDGKVVDRTNILEHKHTAITFQSNSPSGSVVFSWKAPYQLVSKTTGSFSSLSPALDPSKVVGSTCSQAGSTDAGIVTCSGMNTQGGQSFTVHGRRFGTDISGIQVLVGGNAAKIMSADLLSSMQWIAFEIPPGQGLLNTVRVTQNGIGSRIDSLIQISYAPPEIVSKNSGTRRIANRAGIDLRNLEDPRASTQGAQVRIFGSNFGVSGTVELRSSSSGLLGTRLSIVAWGHTEITVRLPAGFGNNYQVFLVVGSQTSLSDPFGYEVPFVNSYTTVSNNGGTLGGDRIAIRGTGFFTSATVTIGGSACVVVSCNHTTVVVLTPDGAGNSNPIVVSVGENGLFQSNNNVLFAYPPPRVLIMTPNHASTSGLSMSNGKPIRMVLVGQNFGSSNLANADRQVFFDKVDVSKNIVLVNHTHLLMHVPSHTLQFTRRTSIVVRVVLRGLSSSAVLASSSAANQFNYDPPTITSAHVVSCSFASGKDCTPSFPVPTDGCHDWSFPRQRITSGSIASANSLDKISWVDDSIGYFRTCVNPVYIELIGSSFGSNGFTSSVDGRFNTSNNDCTDTATCTHAHRRVVMRSPFGFGPPPMQLRVAMQGQLSNEIPWSFAPPQVAYRGSCGYWSSEERSQCRVPYNARGTPFVASSSSTNDGRRRMLEEEDGTERGGRIILEITGFNFGHEDPGDLNIVIGNRECPNAKWIKVHPELGVPYVTCYPTEDIVGIQAGTIYLGGQESSVTADREAFVATCQASLPSQSNGDIINYYGKDGQLCSECPVGALCGALPKDAPVSTSGFYRLSLPTTLPEDGAYTTVDKKNYDRAQGFNDEIRRCSLQQLMNEDLSPELVATYPYAARPDACYDFVACEPKVACTGNNKCGAGYEYLYHQCQNWEEAHYDACKIENVPSETACSSTLTTLNGSAMIHSSGTLEGVPDPSILPEKYRVDTDNSENVCIILGRLPLFDADSISECNAAGGFVVTGLENRNCTTDLDCTSRSGVAKEPGAACTSQHPEECSRCEMRTGTSGERYGMCSCVGSTRCSLCTIGGTALKDGTVMKGFFRQDNECVKCPESPWFLFVTFGIVLVLVIVGAYYLNKKKMNMSFISIGVDYFQVLSLFRNVKTKWPPAILAFFRFLSIFMIDVDIAAPECLIPSLEYSTKWWGTMLIPFIIFVMLLLLFAVQWISMRVKQKYKQHFQRSTTGSGDVKAAGPDLNSLIQLFITFFYYAYIMLAEKGLEVFNCNPTNPDDGFTYTDFTSAKYCDGGLCRCYDASQLQNGLIAPAIVLLLIYGLGFPIFVIVVVMKNKSLIKEDQLLRASHLGDTQLTNPYAFQIRQKYSKLYYHFKPGKVYWMEYIIARKVGIAFAGLFFRANPGFQLSFVLLILFVSYVLQVKNRPYMSTSERVLVVEEHMMKVVMAGELEAEGLKIPNSLKKHQVFAEHLRVATENQAKAEAKAKRERRNKRRKHTSLDAIANDMVKEKKNEEKASYFFDYNTGRQSFFFK